MRRTNEVARLVRLAPAAVLVVVAAGLLAGCTLPESTGTSGSSTDSPFNCWGDPSSDNTTNECVLFARADAADSPGDGTREHPFTSLQTAVDQAAKVNKRVFACGSAPFKESLVVSAPVELWGGFDCDNWHSSPEARTPVQGLPDQPGLLVPLSGAGALIVALAITVPSSEMPGGSAVGVVVENVDTQTFLWRCDVTVGDGRDGLDGDPPDPPAKAGIDAPFVGTSGEPTAACIDVASVAGGAPGELDCGDGKSVGGQGGLGGTAPNGNGQDGADGMPLPPDNPMLQGVGGKGQSSMMACLPGTDGSPGQSGKFGLGGQSAGHVDDHGIAPTDGEPGKDGRRGQGGGGGGAARAGMFCMSGGTTVEGTGASGGGGGAGGCGGKGGKGGMSGGSSIGLVSLGGRLVYNAGNLIVGNGGRGGNGAAGQAGGPGGKGADGGAASGLGTSAQGCTGGDGGHGGDGGPGGGGRGGHSVAIAYVKNPPAFNGHDKLGVGGDGGLGGPGNESGGKGSKGKQIEVGSFSGM